MSRLIVLAISLFVATSACSEDNISGRELHNTIRWATASEVDNFGYDVYRADREEGPFERLTPKPVAGAGTTDEPQRYAYPDKTIAEGKAYYYYVESISLDGIRERFTPIFKSKPKFFAKD